MTVQEQLDIALEALKYYANDKTWHRPITKYPNGYKSSEGMKDSGKVAKEALAKITNQEEV